MKSKSIILLNRLDNIVNKCNKFPINFKFVAGGSNPADFITRIVSYKQLMKSNYFTGPSFLGRSDDSASNLPIHDAMNFIIPNHLIDLNINSFLADFSGANNCHLIPLNRFSDLSKLIRVHRNVLIFLNKLKIKLKNGNPDKYANFIVLSNDHNFF